MCPVERPCPSSLYWGSNRNNDIIPLGRQQVVLRGSLAPFLAIDRSVPIEVAKWLVLRKNSSRDGFQQIVMMQAAETRVGNDAMSGAYAMSG